MLEEGFDSARGDKAVRCSESHDVYNPTTALRARPVPERAPSLDLGKVSVCLTLSLREMMEGHSKSSYDEIVICRSINFPAMLLICSCQSFHAFLIFYRALFSERE